MGITVEQYLKDREACPVCRDHGDTAERCVTALLSREDNCIIYNCIFFNGNPYDNDDIRHLQNLRSAQAERIMLAYYYRSDPIVKHIKILTGHDQYMFWEMYYHKYVHGIINFARNKDSENALKCITKMLDELEAEWHGSILQQ